MKKKKNRDKRIRNYFIFFWASLALFVCMLVIMLVRINAYNDNRSIWPILMTVSMALWIIGCFIIFRNLYLFDKANQGKARTKIRDELKTNQKTYILKDINTSNTIELFSQMLSEFSNEENQLGIVFYKQKKYLSSVDVNVYCLLNSGINNTFDFKIEEENIKLYSNEIVKFCNDKGLSDNYLSCVFVFFSDDLNEEEQDFYNNFIGYWHCEMEKNKIVKNRFFNYCCIERSTSKIYFFQPTKNDEGDEADLSSMILDNLNIKIGD